MIVCLPLWLLVHVESFCSERPYGTARPPLTRGDNASSLLPNIYHGLSYATLTRVDVNRQSNLAVTLVQMMSLVVMTRLAVCIISAAFRINSTTQRYCLLRDSTTMVYNNGVIVENRACLGGSYLYIEFESCVGGSYLPANSVHAEEAFCLLYNE